jgi:hypothetical protein
MSGHSFFAGIWFSVLIAIFIAVVNGNDPGAIAIVTIVIAVTTFIFGGIIGEGK